MRFLADALFSECMHISSSVNQSINETSQCSFSPSKYSSNKSTVHMTRKHLKANKF